MSDYNEDFEDNCDYDNDTYFDVVLYDVETSERSPGAALKGSCEARAADLGDEEHALKLIDEEIGDNSLTVQCDMTRVIHGAMDDGEVPATLIVFRFVFLPRSNKRRFKEVHITITLSAGHIIKITPYRNYHMLRSSKEQTLSHSVSPSLEAAFGPAKATMGYTWQRDENTELEDYAKVEGVMKQLGQNKIVGKKRTNTVIWTLRENASIKSGIPSFMQAAILLHRENKEEKFSADIKIGGQVDNHDLIRDTWRKVKMSGSRRKEEAAIFNPKNNQGDFKDINNLKNINIESYKQLITIRPWIDGANEPSGNKPPSTEAAENSIPDQSIVVSEVHSMAAHPTGKEQQEPDLQSLGTQLDQLSSGDVQTTIKTEVLPTSTSLSDGGGEQQSTVGGWKGPKLTTTDKFEPSHSFELGELQTELSLVRKEAKLVERLVSLVAEERRLISAIQMVKTPQTGSM